MSLDKFGRQGNITRGKVLRGPKGEGFNLTEDGNYDLKHKRLKFVSDPVDYEDVVNLKTLKSSTNDCLKLHDKNTKIYNAKFSRISEVVDPNDASDVVNLNYLKNNCVFKANGVIDVKNFTIRNLNSPVNVFDAVTKSYVDAKTLPRTSEGNYSFRGSKLADVKAPTNPNDVVTLQYLNRILGEVIYNVYNRLASAHDSVKTMKKEDWIEKNIQDKFK